jgi:hypothetical protein
VGGHSASEAPVQADAAQVSAASVAASVPVFVPMVSRKPGVEASGVPQASALVPGSWAATGRDAPEIVPLTARTVSGVLLGCGMAVAALAAVISRRAQPVHAD